MTIRTALVGFGIAGRYFHEPFLAADPRYSLDAVVTSNPERARSLTDRYRVLSSADEVWEGAEDFDLVVIASPTRVHPEHVERAIMAGLPTVVDKPIAVSSTDSRKLVELAESRRVPLTVYHSRRWDGDFQTALRLLREGELGELVRFESSFERQVGGLRDSWRDLTTATEGGGVAYDLGSHLIDQAIVLAGPAVSVHGSGRTVRAGSLGEDDLAITLEHGNGAISRIIVSWVTAPRAPRLRVIGTRASYTVWGFDPQEDALKAGVRPGTAGFGVADQRTWGVLDLNDGDSRPVPTDKGDYGTFYRLLADSLETGKPLPVDPRSAVEVIRAVERALSGSKSP